MKSTLFTVKSTHFNSIENLPDRKPRHTLSIEIPILPAFSIEYMSFQLGPLSAISPLSEDPDDVRVTGTKISMLSDFSASEIEEIYDGLDVIIHYRGIRDYSLLFPWITHRNLRKRLGQFYEEAEKCFDQESWLAFSLMCGAVFEGMLYGKLERPTTNNTFHEMITTCKNRGFLNNHQANIMSKVKGLRNLVHANKYNIPYVERRDAMDIRATLDQLIKAFSN
ncbi:DUF4145 domain-containing protein (plasmid) [Priestia megaterium]|uniref:DUF4145 domain-containing protein n=1 Tax=Priestia megaterium TaxID=1404 RepID=UPI0035BE745A